MATATTPQHTRPPSAASTPAVASTPRRRRMSSSSDDSSKAKLGRILADILRVGCVQVWLGLESGVESGVESGGVRGVGASGRTVTSGVCAE